MMNPIVLVNFLTVGTKCLTKAAKERKGLFGFIIQGGLDHGEKVLVVQAYGICSQDAGMNAIA